MKPLLFHKTEIKNELREGIKKTQKKPICQMI